jgi:hypothetical protein
MSDVHVIVPDGIDDPARPSGGNTYDRRVCQGLAEMGWSVHLHAVPGSWPHPDPGAYAALANALERIPDGAAVLLDGLVASTAPQLLVPQADRLRLVTLVHMPLGQSRAGGDVREREAAVLSAAASVVTTSEWAQRTLVELYAPGTATAGALLCVAAVTPGKGHDVLLDALATMADLPWHCRCVGSLDRDPTFAQRLRLRIAHLGLGERLSFPGPGAAPDLDRSYAAADLMVLASRAETYGMVVIEALARGVPVIAADVGGLTEALGHGADGIAPGLLVSPDDVGALAAALRSWLGDAQLRGRLRRAALERRESLPTWSGTASDLAAILTKASG